MSGGARRAAVPTARIVAFLREIGIEVEPAELGDDTFLPGIAVDRGRLLFDR